MTKAIRKHASIVFTDIVGYTALMGADEGHASKVLPQIREIHPQLVKKYKVSL